MKSSLRVLFVLLFSLALLTASAQAQDCVEYGSCYTYRFYNADNNVIATYIGPLITDGLVYTYTSGFSLNVGAITWVSVSGGSPWTGFSVPSNLLQPCFFMISFSGDPPAYSFACRVLKPDGQPQGTEIEVDFIGPLPTAPGNYYWQDQVTGSHIVYFDGTNLWYAESSTTGHAITRVEIVQPVSTYACTGFAKPFEVPISLGLQARRAIPLQAQLWDHNVLVTADTIAGGAPPVVDVLFTALAGNGQDVSSELLSPGLASSGNSFSFDPTTNTWHFNLGTVPFTSPGTYTVMLKSGNAEQYEVGPTCTGTFVRQ